MSDVETGATKKRVRKGPYYPKIAPPPKHRILASHWSGLKTLYRPGLCEEVVKFMAKGYSFSAFCGSVGISVSTGMRWQGEYPDFGKAVEIGKAARINGLEGGMLAEDVTSAWVTARIFALKNAAPHEFRDRIEYTAEIQQTHTLSLGSLTGSDAMQLAKLLSKAVHERIIDGQVTEIPDPDEHGNGDYGPTYVKGDEP